MKYRESEEMYLETIYLLTKKTDLVRSVDICAELSYSRPSVSRAVGLLKKKGYITVEKGKITLTEEGEERAKNIYERHSVIKQILKKLGATETLAEDNACRIEHVITDELFLLLKNSLEK